MSVHTLIDINHDYLHKLKSRPELLALIMSELCGTVFNGPLNEANERGRALDIGHGVLLVTQRFHDTETTVKNRYVEVKL